MAYSKNQKPGLHNIIKIFPPYRNDYSFFDDEERFEFHPNAHGYDDVNAWWLGELSGLIYDNEQQCRKTIRERLHLNDDAVTWLKHDGVEGMVVDHQGCYMVVFKGTHFPRPSFTNFSSLTRTANNIILDLAFEQVEETITYTAQQYTVKIHKGFKKALGESDNPNSLWSQLQRAIPKHQPIWIAGHSLGGAMATIAAMRLAQRVQGLYTYGAPCIGDVSTVAFINSTLKNKVFRHVNDADIVVHTMQDAKFRHHYGYYDHAGTEIKMMVKGNVGVLFLFTAIADELGLSLLDHSPIYYMLGVRAAMV